jgi:hypothetical protein
MEGIRSNTGRGMNDREMRQIPALNQALIPLPNIPLPSRIRELVKASLYAFRQIRRKIFRW